MHTQKALNNETFLERVLLQLPKTASIWKMDCSENPCGTIPADSLSENTFYLFEAETVRAFTRAIEDFALGQGNGRFLAAFQHANQFEADHRRYADLATAIDEVQVIATGDVPRQVNHLKYCNDDKGLLGKFWIVLYQGVRNRVMFLAEQREDAKTFGEKQFTGFYTFNETIISQAREDVVEILGGTCPELTHFKLLRQIDLVAKRLNVEFASEQKKLELSIHRLRDSKEYQAQHFIEDFEKTLQRLTELKAHLPELISGQLRTK